MDYKLQSDRLQVGGIDFWVLNVKHVWHHHHVGVLLLIVYHPVSELVVY